MKIAFTARPIEQGTSGSGIYLLRIIRALISLKSECEIFLIRTSRQSLDISGISGEFRVSRDPISASREIKRKGVDIVHYSPLTILSPVFIPGVSQVATIHGFSAKHVPEFMGIKNRLNRALLGGRYARRMDLVFTVSQMSADILKHDYHCKRIEIAPPGVIDDFALAEETAGSVGQAEKQTPKGRYIFHVSKCSERKNPVMILRSFEKLVKKPRFKDIRLKIAGSGWRCERVLRWCKRLAILDRVDFLGFIDVPYQIKLLQNAEAFFFPSREEGFGMPNIEAMASGCPVVTSSAFAIPEVVGDGAVVVDTNSPEDYAAALEQVISDKRYRSELILRGKKRAERYTWEKSARVLLAAYRALMAEKAD